MSQGNTLLRINSCSMIQAGVAAVPVKNQVHENCMASCMHEAEAWAGLVTAGGKGLGTAREL